MSYLILKSCDLTPAEIESIASLHVCGISSGFLSRLGEQFLRLLYRSILHSDAGILIVALCDGQVVGFVSGAVSIKPIYKILLKDNYPILCFILLPQIFYWKTLRRIVDILLYSFRSVGNEKIYVSPELLSIAVDKEYRGQGIARALFERLTVEFERHGVSQFKIVVGESLVPAQCFYEKMGAKVRRKMELHKGETSLEYVFDLKI